MTRDEVARWLDRYIEAWRSYDREQIAALFSDDVKYRYHPYDEPITGRQAVVESWLGEGDHEVASERDAEGTYEASYRAVAIDGEVAVAVGSSTYYDSPGGKVIRIYDNCFLIRFDDDGRCLEFTEWFMQQPDA
jgi:ketosteroid isomerase-like protein